MRIDTALNKHLPDNSWELIIGMPDEGQDREFSRTGCGLINSLACDVTEVRCLMIKRNAAGDVILNQEFTELVCDAVLDFAANGTLYSQDARGDWVTV